ncbi:mechanosensitive ion channel family protein [Longirhabdus pacifica]|uniref:mechanosensitive ion channel family protein n=1 Tax=Longirhabdus pacifica TaxID=2305227 RepID=UPI001008ACA1|nr:mechanosensitive ion channel family protein [Longirhabdus pacifica]
MIIPQFLLTSVTDSTDWIDWFTWNFWKDRVDIIVENSVTILLILLFTWLALRVRSAIISRVFKITRLGEKQETTLQSLLMSLTKYMIFIFSILMILDNVGVDIAPIIAGAGVLGLAIGFGAQTMVKDFISGFFIIFEDQFSIGDYVSINNGQINGTVVEVGLRATKIRTWAQHVVVIQNSEITVSQNFNREQMRTIINVSVPYETDPAAIEQSVNEMAAHMVETQPHLFITDNQGRVVEPPQLYGITDLENNALGAKYTVIALVNDIHYWTAGKEIRKQLMEKLKAHQVDISYPRRIERGENVKDLEINVEKRKTDHA